MMDAATQSIGHSVSSFFTLVPDALGIHNIIIVVVGTLEVF